MILLALLNVSATLCVFAQDKNPKLAEKDQIAFDTHFINGNKFIILKQPDEAINELKRALEIIPTNAAAHYSIAQVYTNKGLLIDAEFHATEAVKYDDANTWYKKQLAEIYKHQKQYDKAGDVLAKLYATDAKSVNALFDATYMYVLAKKLDKALKLLDIGEKNIGVHEEIIKQRQSIYLAQNKTDKAIKEGEKLLKSQPNNTRYIGMIADIYSANGKQEKANELYRKILTIEPENGYALLALADDYRVRQNNVEFINYVKKALQSPTLDVSIKLKVVVEFITKNIQTQEQRDKGFELAETLAQANPDEAGAWMLLGDLNAQNRNFAQAHDYYEKAIELNPANHTVWQQMILCSNELRNPQMMLNDCERAIELFPEETTFYAYITFATQQLKLYQKTIDYAKKGLETEINESEMRLQLYVSIGDAAHRLKQYATSDSAFEAALIIDPRNTYALNNYAYFLSLRKEKLDKAAQMSKKTIEIDSRNASYHDTYGWILFVQKNYEEAKKHIEKSLQLEPKNAEVIDHYGDVLFFLGEKEKAVEMWKEAKKLEVDNEVIDKKINNKQWYEQ
jgi:tetratricopeptide (TPR) repeat protein